jgi:hypothetical protein
MPILIQKPQVSCTETGLTATCQLLNKNAHCFLLYLAEELYADYSLQAGAWIKM